MEKQELEELLGYSVTDNLFKGALGYTRNKQEYAYQLEKRSDEAGRTLRDMEKEHSVRNQSAHMDSHIVAVLSL